MSKGFNLILIERDGDSIQALEEMLRKMLPERNPIIVRIVLDKFDQETIYDVVGKHRTLPVKIFVNCKSSKKVEPKKQPVDQQTFEEMKASISNDAKLMSDAEILDVLKKEDELANFELITSVEVHYNGKENIEGYASLVNLFLRSMMMTSKNPCLINVDNFDRY
mmetsp:Transcript_9279/g.15610  ORF Transcript_9279/g.15610 Transcript_9279/m.15610 type:complete len:165 (+) Transcript_9279:498-992(+)